MLGCMLALVFLSIFSVGLAAHTLRFDVHFKSISHEIILWILLVVIVGTGSFYDYMAKDIILHSNPETHWKPDQNLNLPKMRENFQTNSSPWYPLTQNFKIVESCEGLDEEVC